MIPKANPSENTPRFSYRGFMLDTVRHFSTVEDILRILDQMAALKLNVFHWHLANDQGYRLESRRFKKLNEVASFRNLDELDPLVEKGLCQAGERYGGFYTFEQVRQVTSYAADRGITVVPEIEMPGHAAAILAAYPELSCDGRETTVAATFGIHDRVFCAGNEAVYKFLEALLDEVCDLFDSPWIHIGGDEAPKDAWHSCPKCQQLMRQRNFRSHERLQSHFTNRIISHLKTKGKTAIVWNESAYDGTLDPEAIVQYWMEMAPGESYMPKEFPMGRKLILSNQNPFYCDYSYAETPLRATLQYEPQVKDVPVPPENVLGIEATLWTEWLPTAEDREKMIWPRLLAFAECAWTKERDTEDFLERAKQYLHSNASFLTAMPWEQANPQGDDALRQIAQNMLALSARHARMAAKEGRTVRANVHEDAEPVDPQVQVFEYMKEKMLPAYTEADVKKVLYFLSQMRNEH